jgi:branched-subunit amino acid ABC-type transport system permease component
LGSPPSPPLYDVHAVASFCRRRYVMFYIFRRNSQFGLDLGFCATTLCYSGLLSLLGLALLLRHRASGIPDFSLVLNVGLGVVMSTVAVLAGLNLYVGPVLAFAAGCLLGAVEYRGVLRLMERRGDGEVRRTLATIGLLILGHTFLSCATYWAETHLPDGSFIFHLLSKYDIWVGDTRGIFFVVPLVCAGVYLIFYAIRRRTRFWQTLTASGEAPGLAMAHGVDPWRVRLGAWVLSGGITCLAGSLYPPFYHMTPGGEEGILLPLFAVFILGGFESALCTIVAAYIVGFTEHLGTLVGQYLFGYWFSDYRLLIPIAFIYFGLLFLPRGLPDLWLTLRKSCSFFRRNQENAVKVTALVLVVVGFSALVWNAQTTTIVDEKTGWINVSNRVGRAGATIYSDSEDPNLPESLRFKNAYPATVSEIQHLYEFTNMIQAKGITVVYLHNGALYIFIDSAQGYVYSPGGDNYGR